MTTAITERGAAVRTRRIETLGGWGRLPLVTGFERLSEDLEAITEGAVLTRGLGRSYGDASLPPPGPVTVAASRLADRLLSFDPSTGILRAEAGLSLLAVTRVFLERGWFTPVSPGTQYVTLGGMVAADVHGKNHHEAGTFGRHVTRLKMRVADGRIVEASEEENRDLFLATLGGMGLTGHILEVEFRLDRIPSPWIWAESETLPSVDALVEHLVEAGRHWPLTAGWADCLGRGRSILYKGRWADPLEAPPQPPSWGPPVDVPFAFPNWVLNPLAVRAFNAAYYLKNGLTTSRGIVHPQAFFYPLDAVLNWNRFYGKRGFIQYQCVLPRRAPLGKFFRLMADRGASPYLCVVKDFGDEGRGMLSFPKPGITLALDIPGRGAETARLVDALGAFVAAEGGRVYLAKDALTRPEHFRAMDPRVDAFDEVRRRWDPHHRIRSAQSVRVFGDPE